MQHTSLFFPRPSQPDLSNHSLHSLFLFFLFEYYLSILSFLSFLLNFQTTSRYAVPITLLWLAEIARPVIFRQPETSIWALIRPKVPGVCCCQPFGLPLLTTVCSNRIISDNLWSLARQFSSICDTDLGYLDNARDLDSER